jgi:hypothetical protein
VLVAGPDGTVQGPLPLALTGPGLYTAEQAQQGPGIYTARLDGGAGGEALAPWEVAALTVPYPAEYAGGGVDTATLAGIAAETGGHLLTRPAGLFSQVGLPVTPTWLPLWPFLLALALLLFPADVALRLVVLRNPRRRD